MGVVLCGECVFNLWPSVWESTAYNQISKLILFFFSCIGTIVKRLNYVPIYYVSSRSDQARYVGNIWTSNKLNEAPEDSPHCMAQFSVCTNLFKSLGGAQKSIIYGTYHEKRCLVTSIQENEQQFAAF